MKKKNFTNIFGGLNDDSDDNSEEISPVNNNNSFRSRGENGNFLI